MHYSTTCQIVSWFLNVGKVGWLAYRPLQRKSRYLIVFPIWAHGFVVEALTTNGHWIPYHLSILPALPRDAEIFRLCFSEDTETIKSHFASG
jgi:hypothetical protein